MEFSKQEIELFFPLPGPWSKNFFYKTFLIWSKVFKINFQNRKKTYFDLVWPIWTHLDLSWPILTQLDLSWPILTYFDLSWPIFTYFCLFSPILINLDLSWPLGKLRSLCMIMLVRAKYTYTPNCTFIVQCTYSAMCSFSAKCKVHN